MEICNKQVLGDGTVARERLVFVARGILMLKMLIVLPNLSVANGVASFAMNYFRKLDYKEVKVDFVVDTDMPSPYYDEIHNVGGKVHILPPMSKLSEHYKKCKEIFKETKYDIVHDNSLHASMILMMAARKNKVPVRILHSHNSKLGETKKKEIRNKCFLPVLYSIATDYAACSEIAGNAMFGNKNFTVIPNVIDEDKFCFHADVRKRVRSELCVGEKFIIATVGRLAYQKNPFFAIDAFKEFLQKNPDAEYWWIGDGPMQEEIATYIETKKLGSKIKLLGNRTDIVDLYQAIDCFFLPSLFEGLPVVGIEAQAMGLPCIVADTITKEMKYTDLVKYISLDAQAEEWCDGFFWARAERDRTKYNHELRNSMFASERAGSVLEEYYKELQKKNG